MTCAECELLLAQNEGSPEAETSPAVEAHVAGCADCRSLAVEILANTHAMRALGAEHFAAEPIRARPAYPWWKWSSAAAAVAVTLAAAWFVARPPKPPQIVSIDVNVTGVLPAEVPVKPAEIPAKLSPRPAPVSVAIAQSEPLRVKMLTPDPDVVIYWLVDSKGELE